MDFDLEFSGICRVFFFADFAVFVDFGFFVVSVFSMSKSAENCEICRF